MTMVIIGILAAIAIPSFNAWLPGMRLKSAARDVYSNLQKARLQALKENRPVPVRFVNTATNDYLYFDMDDDSVFDAGEYSLNITGYKSGVGFGHGSAINNWSGTAIAGPLPTSPVLTFSNRGTAGIGTVYLENERQDDCYAITVVSSGSIKLRRYSGTTWLD